MLIHLWNVRQGKILKVGSIALLQESDRQQARSIKLKDLLLLLLRCLLIILLAMLLAKPQYQKQLTIKDEKGWIVVPRTELEAAYKNYKPLIDSLIKAGYQFHYFEKGFAKEQLAQALQSTNEITDKFSTPYWQTLNALDKELPAELPVYLFTGNELKSFTGHRPSISMNLVWKTFAVEDSVSVFLSNAYLSSIGTVKVAIAGSKPLATVQSFTDISLQQPPPNFTVRQEERMLISYKDSLANKSQVEVDTAALNVVIFTDQFANDANYVRAAINAIRVVGKYRINLSVVRNVVDIPVNNDWLFWLSEQALPQKVSSKNILVYEKGKEEAVHSWVVVSNGNGYVDVPIETTKRVPGNDSLNDNNVWKDGFGNPLLSIENDVSQVNAGSNIAPPATGRGQGGQVYHFYSRFNPSWNEIVWSSQFPALMYDLLYGGEADIISPLDKRVIDLNQLQPVLTGSSKAGKKKFVRTVDLSKLFWLLAFLVFCLERFISLKTRKEVVNG